MSDRLARGRGGPRAARGTAPVLLVVAVVLLVAAVAWARPGGGGGFSGGGGGGGGSGGVGGVFAAIELVLWLIELTLDYPQFMLPLFGVLGIYLVYHALAGRRRVDWSSASGASTPARADAPGSPKAPARERREGGAGSAGAGDPHARSRGPDPGSPDASYARLIALDPEFSPIVFEDFLYALYAEAHSAREPARLAELAPYLDPSVRATIDRIHAGATAVSQFVIGSMRLDPIGLLDEGGEKWAVAAAEFETNYAERGAAGERGFYSRERWRLRRRAAARSRSPARARVFRCPNCDAALEGMRGSICSYCGERVDTGRFDWVLVELTQLERAPREPVLTADHAEQGTELPTIYSPGREAGLAALRARDPAFERGAFEARIKVIFDELQIAWSQREWRRVRPFLSDSLFQMELGFIEAYQRAKLRNVTENARIARVQIAKVSCDRHYDAITVRLYAASLDYTVSDEGKLVAGSRSRTREYSEYWTLIRGVAARGAARADRSCPNCGAGLEFNMAGECQHCRARIGCGEFDWVLSRIEQDEAYRG